MPSRDYEEFLESLNARRVRYLIVGAHAVAFHARPRATKDLDILIDPTAVNADRVLSAIRDFLGSDLGLDIDDLLRPGNVVQLGVAPMRIDLLSRLASRADFNDLWRRRKRGRFSDVRVSYPSLEDLIREKTAAGRDQDVADARVLRLAQRKRRPE